MQPWTTPQSPQLPEPVFGDEVMADFGVLRPLLDTAGLGEPTEEGIPRRNFLTQSMAAAQKHSVPFREAIARDSFPKSWESRPLAS